MPAQATAVWRATRRKEICWRSAQALQRYVEGSTQQLPDWSRYLGGRSCMPTVQNGAVVLCREPLVMKKIVWQEPRTREEYARHSLSVAHQHKVVSVPTAESHSVLPSDCSVTREHTVAVSISPPTRDLQGGMSWSSSYRMDERTHCQDHTRRRCSYWSLNFNPWTAFKLAFTSATSGYILLQ